MLVLLMVFEISVALALGFVVGRIYQIRRELEGGFTLPPTARIPGLDCEAEPGRRSAAKLLATFNLGDQN